MLFTGSEKLCQSFLTIPFLLLCKKYSEKSAKISVKVFAFSV
jgi:hypothetical protein